MQSKICSSNWWLNTCCRISPTTSVFQTLFWRKHPARVHLLSATFRRIYRKWFIQGNEWLFHRRKYFFVKLHWHMNRWSSIFNRAQDRPPSRSKAYCFPHKLYTLYHSYRVSRDSVGGIATGYRLDDWGVGVRVLVGSRFFSSHHHPDQIWRPSNLLSNGYRGLFPGGKAAGTIKLTTHLQLVLRSRKCGSIHPLLHTPSWHSA
jgi:hypothetical protein